MIDGHHGFRKSLRCFARKPHLHDAIWLGKRQHRDKDACRRSAAPDDNEHVGMTLDLVVIAEEAQHASLDPSLSRDGFAEVLPSYIPRIEPQRATAVLITPEAANGEHRMIVAPRFDAASARAFDYVSTFESVVPHAFSVIARSRSRRAHVQFPGRRGVIAAGDPDHYSDLCRVSSGARARIGPKFKCPVLPQVEMAGWMVR